MRKLGKRLNTTCETVEAFACICSCSYCDCDCSPILATSNYYDLRSSNIDRRESSMRY